MVINKYATQEQIAQVFKRYHGMEHCDLKVDPNTGLSNGYCFVNYSTPEMASRAAEELNGYCFVNYSTPEMASRAAEELNGTEFPPHSGHTMKVLFADVMVPRQSSPQAAYNRKHR
eukprot:gene14534-20568_t